ncbi:MAG: HIT domain-containing protein [Nanoarchaeota archaeon]|nr:HIT domain-containing protein [Nanoarchaeota archaeon]
MKECIFCKIVNGEIPCEKVYEDEFSFAFLDINPINEGHTLVIPKKHYPNFYDLPDKDYMEVNKAIKKISTLIHKNINPKKVGLLVSGWDVDHTHFHIIPMYDYHDITSKKILENTRLNPSKKDLEKTAKKIRGIKK